MAFISGSVPREQTLVNFGSLAVLVPLIRKLDLDAIFNRHIETDPQAEFSHGAVLSVLVAARLHQPTALMNVTAWAAENGVEHLCNIPPEKLNDDRLGRALDAFFEHRHAVLADVTAEVLKLTKLTLDCCHFDPTHLVLYGAYRDSKPRPASSPQTSASSRSSSRSSSDALLDRLRNFPAHITRGYLTKYKMLQLGLTSVVDDLGAVPVACHLYDGNRSGHIGVQEQYHLLRHYLDLPDNLLFVSDRGTCSAEHLGRLLSHGHYALCAAHWQDYLPLYKQHAASLKWQTASYLSREQIRRRKCNSTLPLDEYRLAVVKHQLVDPKTQLPFDCRVMFVHSSAAARESKERREKNIAKIRAGLQTCADKLKKGHSSTTPQSVQRQIERLLGKKNARHFFRWSIVPLTDAERSLLPPPPNGHRGQMHRLEFSFDQTAAEADAEYDGIYAMVTTAPPTWSGDVLLTEYKRQIYSERENHELKTPLAVAPIFLKTPQRVEALVSLIFLALQAYMTLERLYRQSVPETAEPSQRRMTAEKILKKFRTCSLLVEEQPYGELIQVGHLTAEQRTILTQLSFATPTEILRSNLPPPPC